MPVAAVVHGSANTRAREGTVRCTTITSEHHDAYASSLCNFRRLTGKLGNHGQMDKPGAHLCNIFTHRMRDDIEPGT